MKILSSISDIFSVKHCCKWVCSCFQRKELQVALFNYFKKFENLKLKTEVLTFYKISQWYNKSQNVMVGHGVMSHPWAVHYQNLLTVFYYYFILILILINPKRGLQKLITTTITTGKPMTVLHSNTSKLDALDQSDCSIQICCYGSRPIGLLVAIATRSSGPIRLI